MATSIVSLDTTQYVRVNVGYKTLILQALRDSVRIAVSEAQPASSNTAFHTLGGEDAPLHLDVVDTNVWVLAVSDKSSLIVTESDTSFATEETVSQLVMAVTNAIDETAYDLNAAAFSETTNIVNDYDLISVEMNFTTTSIRDITITSPDGTILLEDKDNIDKNFVWADIHQSFKGGENITIDITQVGAACLVDVKLRTQSGTNSLLGDPDVRIVDSLGNVYEDTIQSHCMPTVDINHFFTHAGATFSNSDTATVVQATFKDFLIITPAVSESHLITFHMTSTQANAEVVIYEAPTTTANGTALTLFNKNRKSSKVAETLLYKDPTVTVGSEGTQLAHDLIVGGKQSGGNDFSETGEEYVLAPSTKYLIRFNNNSNQDDVMDWKISFLEPAQI
jgi:hypothetical protein